MKGFFILLLALTICSTSVLIEKKQIGETTPSISKRYNKTNPDFFDCLSDGTGLEEYNYCARTHDPQLGHWHVIDPDPQKYSLMTSYGYGANNPLKCINSHNDTIVPIGNAAEIKQINTGLRIVALTNKKIYDTLQASIVNFKVSVKDLLPPKHVDLSTGDQNKINYLESDASREQQGKFYTNFKTLSDVTDDTPSISGMTFSKESTDDHGNPIRIGITEGDANKLVHLVDANIEIERTLDQKDFAETIAHELGHAFYTLTNSARADLSAGSENLLGHDEGNPNGQAAENAEAEFRKNYRMAIRKLKKKKRTMRITMMIRI